MHKNEEIIFLSTKGEKMEEIIFQGEVAGCVAEQVIREREFAMTTRHFHESYEVYVLLDGSRYYFIENETYLVEAGMIVLVGRNQIQRLRQ